MNKKQQILITGADGFVGTHLCRALENDYEIIRLITPGVESEDMHSFSIDLTSKQEVVALADKLRGESLCAVIHLAFILCKPGDWDNFIYLHKNNRITENMIEFCKRIHSKSFLNFSSLAVYPNRDGNYNETSQVDPSTNTECLYGLAKFNSEILFTRFLSKKTNVVNFRMCQVYGSGMQEDRLVGLFQKELREKNTITVFGDGERISNFIHVDDVCETVRKVLQRPVAGTFNLGCHDNISYFALAEKIIETVGTSNSKIVKRSEGVIAKVRIDVSKIERTYDLSCICEDYNI